MPVLGQGGLGIGAQYLGETAERLREVEDASFGTLPSRLSLALAETTLPLDALRRAARIAARYLDISPAEAGFRPYGNTPPEGPLSLWTDPLTGSVVSLATARRILRPYERSVAQRILEQLASRPAREGVRGRVPVIVSTEDVDRLTEAIRALAPLRGEDLPFQDALAFAIAAAADRGLDLDLVRANLEYLTSLPGLAPHPLLAAEIARRAAGSGRLLRSPADVVAIAAPGYEEAVRLAETPAGQRPASRAFAASRAALGPAAEASLATSAALAGVPETAPGGTGVRAELAQVELGQRLVMGLELPGSFLESFRDAEQDYVRAGRRIAEQVKIPFTDTVAGRAVLKTLDVIVRPFDAVTRVVFDRYLYVAPFGQEEAGQGGRYNITEALHDAWDIMLGRTTAAKELAEDTGVPEWLTFVGQLLVGSKLDPVAAALSKYGTLTRGRRFLVTLAEEGRAAEWPVRVEEWIKAPMARFGPLSKLTRSEYLVEAALRERDPAKYFARAVADFRAYHAGVGIDPLVAERIWRLARSGKTLGLSRAEIVEAVDDVLRAGFGIPPRGGSVAARVLEETEAYVARRAEQLPLFLADGSAYRPPPTRLRPEAARFVSALDDAMLDLEMRGPRMLELPHRADPVSRLEHRLRTSPLAETTAGRTIRSLLAGPDTTPQHVGAYLEIPVENPARAVREFRGALIRSQVFSNEEIERAALAYAKAIRPSSPTRGLTAASVVSSYERTMLRRIWKRYGIDEDTARVVLDRLHRRFGGSPRSEVFAALAGEEGVTLVSRPILATQEVNALRMIDPALVRRAVSETIGTWRRWTQAITRGLGASRPAKVPIRRFIDDALDAVVQDAFLSWYRPLVVIRPAYVLRIVGIEETSRFLSTVGLSRWASSGRVLGGERIAQAAERLGLMGAAERIRARGEAIVEIPELAQLGYEPRIRVPNPSGLAEEPLVNAATSQFGRAVPGPLESRLREALSPTSWGAVERTREDFVEWWWHALVHQFGRDEIGSMYLRDIADGLDEETSVLRALEFLRSDEGRRVATRIMGPGYTDEALEVQVRTGVRYARQLTGSNPELARAAAEGTLTPEALRAVPQAARPEYVHGPLLSETVLARRGPLKRGVEAISRMIMQTPTNRLTRQKYFRTWYTRTLEAQLRVAKESGLFGMHDLATEVAALPLHSSDELARKLEQVIGALSPDALNNPALDDLARATHGDDVVYRGMSIEEWQEALDRGYIQSAGVQKAQQGETWVTTFFSQAAAYAGPAYGRAWSFRPGFGSAADRIVVALKKPKSFTAEVGALRDPIPTKDIVAAYRVRSRQLTDEEIVPWLRQQFDLPEGTYSDDDVLRIVGEDLAETEMASTNFPLGEEFSTSDMGAAEFIRSIPEERLRQAAKRYALRYGSSSRVEPLREIQISVEAPMTSKAAALIEGMHASARAFAIDQVRRIMFDFTRQGRLDEVTRHFLMFVQPYAEFWVSWGRIIRQNPSVLAVANRIGVLGSRSGIVREDPETGELIVPLSLWAGAAPLLAAVTGGRIGPRVGGGWQLSAPLASFNLFVQSAVPIPTGELAGEVPIPVPSLNPQAVALLQNMLERSDIRSDVRARLASWLFAYGPVDPSKPGTLLPAWLHHAIASVFPEWFEAEQRMQQTHFLQLQQAMGLDPDPDLAREQARRFAGLRALFALVFPAAPRIEFPTAELERRWRAIRDSSPDWTTARQRFLELHPDMDLITMARTMWEQDNGSPVQIPASLDVQQLLSTKGAREFAERHPRWVWAIIPRELREGELDIGSFFAQLASGDRQAFTPEEFIANAEVQRGWDAYAVARDAWVAWQEAHPDLGPGDPPYDEQYRDFQATIEHIAELNPAWRVAREKIEIGGVDPAVLSEARQLAKDEVFARTEAGKWLRAYLELRDRTARELAEAGVSSLETQTAQRLGITERYQAELERLNERYPDGATAYRVFFTGDLKRVPSAGDRALDRLPEGFVDQELTPWWERYEELRRAPEQATDESARTDAYNALRSYVDAAFERFPNSRNPLILRWRASDPTWREEVLAGILGRPYPYLDRFAKQVVLGERTSGAAERIWTQYLQMRAEIARAEATDPSFSSTRAYEALGRWVAAQASANAVFARQLEHANSWTWRVRRALEQLVPDRERSEQYWQALFETVDTIQSVVDRMRLGGSFDQRAKAAYNAMRQTLVDYIEQLRRSSLEFDRQWEYLEGLSGADPLVGYLMPAWGDYYGPIEGYGKGG